MERMTKAEVLRRCIVIFEAIRRVHSKGSAGLEALEGAEDFFRADCECCQILKQMLRDMESGDNGATAWKDSMPQKDNVREIKDWQKMAGPPERLVL